MDNNREDLYRHEYSCYIPQEGFCIYDGCDKNDLYYERIAEHLGITSDPMRLIGYLDLFDEDKKNQTPCYPNREWPGLFYEFASLDMTEDSILRFANKHGQLFVDGDDHVFKLEAEPTLIDSHKLTKIAQMQVLKTVSQKDIIDGKVYYAPTTIGVPVMIWFRQIWEMKRAIELMNDANSGSLKSKIILRDYVNEKIGEYAVPRIEIDFTNNYLLTHAPHNLLGLMWMQLALELTGQLELKQCDFCHKWFRVGPGDDSNKTSRTTCDAACRNKLYRKKIKDGTSPKRKAHNQLSASGNQENAT